jgi:hypothetical protein
MINYILSIKEGIMSNYDVVYKENSALYENVHTYFISLLLKNQIDKNYFLTLIKKVENKDSLLLTKKIVEFFKIISILYRKSGLSDKENKQNFSSYLSIVSDLLLFNFLKGEILEKEYNSLKSDLEKFASEVTTLEEENLTEKIKSGLKIMDDKMLRYQRCMNKEDLVVEHIKI